MGPTPLDSACDAVVSKLFFVSEIFDLGDLAFITRFQPFCAYVRLCAHYPLTTHIKSKVSAQGTTLYNLTPDLEGQLRPQNAIEKVATLAFLLLQYSATI